jgi:hypothetical protein
MSQQFSSLALYCGRVIRTNPRPDCVSDSLGRGRQLGTDLKNTVRNETLIPGCFVHCCDSRWTE